jgi:predicted MPP superfamily phosphohydrolase
VVKLAAPRNGGPAAVLSRRTFLKTVGLGALGFLGLSSYAFAIEPRFRLVVTRYRLTPPSWPAHQRPVRLAVVADIHACDPWMPLSRVAEIVAVANSLKPDATLLLGDYVPGLRRFRTAVVPPTEWGGALAGLSAPLGVYGVIGNHDWWHDVDGVRHAFAEHRIPLMENDVVRLEPKDGPPFWLIGLGDQLAHPLGHGEFRGEDDLPGALALIPEDGAPIVLMAHEPDIFPEVPERVSLTISGHTHGGQVDLPLIGRPVVPSKYGDRYAYGHVVENDRHLIVSGGLGCSILPVRLGVPPEIVLIELGGNASV